MSEVVIVACTGAVCVEPVAAVERGAEVRAMLDEARARMASAGLWSVTPVIVLDARLDGVVASSVIDAASEGLTQHAGRPAILFARGAETHLDVWLHELTHVWMRAEGARDARWQHDGGRAHHEVALVYEALADFVAATLTDDPVVGEGLALTTTHSLRVVATCPDDLTGFASADAVIVSGALWELGGGRDTLAAVTQSALGAQRVEALVDRVASALAARSPALAQRWAELVERRGLRRCDAPIAIGPSRVSAHSGEFLGVGTQRFGLSEVSGPLRFTAAVSGTKTARITLRSSQRDALAITWQARDPLGDVIAAGRAPLAGWPSQFATVSLPPSDHLTFAIVNTTPHDLTFNDVALTSLEAHPSTVASVAERPGSGCLAAPFDPFALALPLLLGALLRRRGAARPWH